MGKTHNILDRQTKRVIINLMKYPCSLENQIEQARHVKKLTARNSQYLEIIRKLIHAHREHDEAAFERAIKSLEKLI
jgi:hypothetical protein